MDRGFNVAVLVTSTREEKRLLLKRSATVGDVRKGLGAAREEDLVLHDAKPPRVLADATPLSECALCVTQEWRALLRFQLMDAPRAARSWREVAVSAPRAAEAPKPQPQLGKTPGLLKLPSQRVEVPDDEEGEKEADRQRRNKPRPSDSVLLSDLIASQLKGKSGAQKAGKGVVISLSSALHQQKEEAKRAPGKMRSNPNPADGRTEVKERGKERINPKKKRLTKLKLIIDSEKRHKEALAKKEGGETEQGQKTEDIADEDKTADVMVVVTQEKEKEEEEESGSDDSGDEAAKEQPPEPESERVNFLLIRKPFSNLDLKLRSATELEMNRKITFFLSELRRFQARLYEKNPEKAAAKRRLLSGLREVDRAARRNKLRCVFLAPNVEDYGGLNDIQISILGHCKTHNIPLVIGMTRATLGHAMGKRSSVSAVGVADYDGANELWKEIAKMYAVVAKEREERTALAEAPPVAAVAEAPKSSDAEEEKKSAPIAAAPVRWKVAEFVPRAK